MAGLFVNFYFANVGTIGPSRRGTVIGLFVEAGFDINWQSLARSSHFGNFRNVHGPVGAGNNEAALFKYDVSLSRFQKMCCNALTFFDDSIRSDTDCPAAQHRSARSKCTHTPRNQIRITVAIMNQFRVDPKPV